MDPDRPLRIRSVVLTTSAFTVLAVVVAFRQMSEAGVGLAGGLAIVAGGAALGMVVGLGMFLLIGSASRGVMDTLLASRGLPPGPSFSEQEAMIAQGRHREAAGSDQHLMAPFQTRHATERPTTPEPHKVCCHGSPFHEHIAVLGP